MTTTIEALNSTLANTYSLYLKTQSHHWNVTGPSFKALHELFGLQYEEMIPAIDIIAERIRTLGAKVEGSYDNFAKLTKFESAKTNLNAQEMVQDLINSNQTLVEILKMVIEVAQNNNDEATADILISRVEAHEKHLWMLKSSL